MNEKLPKVIKVIMWSEEFGFEDFFYDTIVEARKGFELLKKECVKQFNKDGIRRLLFLVIEKWEYAGET